LAGGGAFLGLVWWLQLTGAWAAGSIGDVVRANG
jgi:hypothetical protein